jgi:hypothetical protein
MCFIVPTLLVMQCNINNRLEKWTYVEQGWPT